MALLNLRTSLFIAPLCSLALLGCFGRNTGVKVESGENIQANTDSEIVRATATPVTLKEVLTGTSTKAVKPGTTIDPHSANGTATAPSMVAPPAGDNPATQ
jgi:hypothetical protein